MLAEARPSQISSRKKEIQIGLLEGEIENVKLGIGFINVILGGELAILSQQLSDSGHEKLAAGLFGGFLVIASISSPFIYAKKTREYRKELRKLKSNK